MALSSLFALIIGMFIIYNSFAIAVTHRRSEIGILRALGATRNQVQRLFLMESILAGLVGSVIGAALGIATASAIARYISVVVEAVGGVAQRVTAVEIDSGLIAWGIVIGVGTSILAAWIPARNAARVDPVHALQKGKYQVLSAGENRRRRWTALAAFVISIGCLFFSNSKPLFYLGYGLIMIAGLLLAPALTLVLSQILRPILKQLLPAEGTLAADSLVQAPRRTSATVSALMLSVAMVVGFGGFAHSFYSSVGEWMDDALNPDFFVAPSENLSARNLTFHEGIGAVITNVEGVDQVQLVRDARIVYHDVPVMLLVIEAAKVASTVHRVPIEGSLDEMNRLTAEGKGLFVSESFASNLKARMGDVIDLPTPSGLLKLPIVGIVRDYSDLQGSLFIDRAIYRTWWKDDAANVARVYVKKGQNIEAVRQRVITALMGQQRLLVLTNQAVRDWIMKLLDQWFGMTYNQIVVAILVAILGIVNTLTVSITDRKRELGVMQAVGGLRSQVRRTVWIEALSIATIGLVLGAGLGAVNLYYTLGTVKRDLGGIDLDYIFPFSFMAFMIPTILGTAFIAALGPGEAAVRANLVEALEYE